MSVVLRSGLRVYVNTVGADTFTTHGVFYSRRENGPFYRWHYEAEGERWRGSRVHLETTPKSFRKARERVPPTLQTRLLEHYED